MPKILIANIDNESMMGDQRGWTREFYLVSAMLAARHVWFAEPGDIVVLPRAIKEKMQRYVFDLLGHARDSVTILVPAADPSAPGPLDNKRLLSPEFLFALKQAMSRSNEWAIWPYIFDRGIVNLLRELELGRNNGSSPFLLEGGAELLNDKRVFRAVAAGRGVKLAPGRIATSRHELARAFVELMASTGSVIVKQDRHSSADGNLVVTTTPGISGQGAASMIEVGIRDLRVVADEVWDRLAYQERTSLVIETYYQVEKVLYAEFNVAHAVSTTSLLNWGEPRMNPGFFGLIMPPAVAPYKAAKFISGATELARIACELGFNGLIDVDGIVTTNGEVVFNEVNGRTGGCSHVHHISERLVGSDYGDQVVVATNNKVVARDFDALLRSLSETGLGFDKATRRGLVITAEDIEGCGLVEVLSIGRTEKDALSLEQEFKQIAGSACL